MNLSLYPINLFACSNNAVNTNNNITKQNNNNQNSFVIPQKQMVNAEIALANYKIPKFNTSFKGNIKNDEMSDEEFKKLKQEIKEKIKKLPASVRSEMKIVGVINII